MLYKIYLLLYLTHFIKKNNDYDQLPYTLPPNINYFNGFEMNIEVLYDNIEDVSN